MKYPRPLKENNQTLLQVHGALVSGELEDMLTRHIQSFHRVLYAGKVYPPLKILHAYSLFGQ